MIDQAFAARRGISAVALVCCSDLAKEAKHMRNAGTGLAIGIAIGNVGVGIAIGVALGVAFGAATSNDKKS